MSTDPTTRLDDIDPQYKELGGTSQEAAEDVKEYAATVRRTVLKIAMTTPAGITPDMLVSLTPYELGTLRPRFTELKQEGLLVKTSRTMLGLSGKRVRVWEFNPSALPVP